MKINFIGAAREVTGSCHYLEAAGVHIVVDCGMEQGSDVYENQELPLPMKEIDYVLLTHAHIDHSGLLPLMTKNGFQGKIITTAATKDLCEIMLRDSAHIQEFEAEWRNRKAKRAGMEHYEPIYTMSDAQEAIEKLVQVEYNKKINLCEGIDVRFQDVGHLLGSACIEVWLTEDGISKKIVFSGDIGNVNQPILKEPTLIEKADYVVIESTYGNRVHSEELPDYVSEFVKILSETFQKGGNVLIPSFAVGRTQELLYFIREIKEKGLLDDEFQDFEVYVDSPLAVAATKVFNKNMKECFDEEALELVNRGINPLEFSGLTLSVTAEDSKAINVHKAPKVIISASGMCEAGRIRHHLKHNLWRKESTILFVGYQVAGTLGHALLGGAASVKLFGERIEVCARIEKLKGISGHADKNGLLRWLRGFQTPLAHVFVVHGEDRAAEEFARSVQEEFGCQSLAPYSGAVVNLAENKIEQEGYKIKKRASEKPAKRKAETVFNRLVAAGKRLMNVILKCEGMANKDLTKFETQIHNLADKWEK